MGLFSRNKKKKRQSAPKRAWLKAKPSKNAPARDLTGVWRVGRVGLTVVLLAALAGGVWYGHRTLADQIGRGRATQPVVVLHDLPTWIGTRRADSIKQVVLAHVSNNPMDRASLEAVNVALSNNPWIAEVKLVQRRDAGQVDVFVDYRTPVALVGAKDGFHLVDADGRRLPDVYPYAQLKDLGLPAITGARHAPPQEGKVWPGDDLQNGLAMVRTMTGQPWSPQVRAIDVTNHRGRENRAKPHLLLVTQQGLVNWGRAPGEEGIYEPSAERKLAMLARVADAYGGRIDAAGQEVDVYTDTPLIRARSTVRYTATGE